MQCSIMPRALACSFLVPGCHGHVFDKGAVRTETLGNGEAVVREHLSWFLNGLFLESTSASLLLQTGDPLWKHGAWCHVSHYQSSSKLHSINYYCVSKTLDLFHAIISIFSSIGLYQQLHYFTDDRLLISSKLWISLKSSQYLISTACCTQRLGMPFFCSYALFVSGKEIRHILSLHLKNINPEVGMHLVFYWAAHRFSIYQPLFGFI